MSGPPPRRGLYQFRQYASPLSLYAVDHRALTAASVALFNFFCVLSERKKAHLWSHPCSSVMSVMAAVSVAADESGMRCGYRRPAKSMGGVTDADLESTWIWTLGSATRRAFPLQPSLALGCLQPVSAGRETHLLLLQ